MTVEAATFITGLNPTEPTGSREISTADDHIRLLKYVLQNTLGLTAQRKYTLNDGAEKSWAVRTITANITLTAADDGKLILVDASAGDVIVAFPAASTLPDGFRVSVKRFDDSVNAVTLTSAGGAFDGAVSWTLPTRWSVVNVRGNGEAYYFDAIRSVFASGTKMLFAQATVPVGWTKDTTWDDKVLMVTSGTGATTGGSWTLSGISGGAHALSLAEIPDHGHLLSTDSGGMSGSSYRATRAVGIDTAAGTLGAAAAHTHPMTLGDTWRPAYATVIVGIKD